MVRRMTPEDVLLIPFCHPQKKMEEKEPCPGLIGTCSPRSQPFPKDRQLRAEPGTLEPGNPDRQALFLGGRMPLPRLL